MTEYFPIHSGTKSERGKALKISMDFMLRHNVQAFKNHGQSVERLAERGGCVPREIYAIITGQDYFSIFEKITEEQAVFEIERLTGSQKGEPE